jgi:two-component system osmolarity sensor histidine kinase EnvZ
VTLLPRSLFGRLVLLLITVVALAVLTSVVMFRHDRAELLVRHFSDTKLAQLQALRAALEGADGPNRRETLQRLNREYGVRIVPEGDRPGIGQVPLNPMFTDLTDRLRASLGPDTEVRIAPRMRLLLVRVNAGGEGYWVGFPMPERPQAEDIPSRALTWTLVVLALLLAAAYVFARFLARPLRELTSAVDRVGRGETPEPLPESGPSEIAAVNRGFNAMLGTCARSSAIARCSWPAFRTTCAPSRAAATGHRARNATTPRGRHGRRHRGNGPHHRTVPRFRARRCGNGA